MGNLLSSSNEDSPKQSLPSYLRSSLQNGIPAEAALFRRDAHQLRSKAKAASEKSQNEYRFGCKAEAKALSIKKSELYRQMNDKNQRAAELIFEHFNQNRSQNVIDLHGLYVAEALQYLQDKLDECRSKRMSELTVITGMGNNSSNNIAKIKPEVENFVHRNHLKVTLHGGHIVIDLSTDDGPTVTSSQNTARCIIL